jgi:hypothetical protein
MLDHYNNSIANFNLHNTEYRYISRQHTQQITHLVYNANCNKIVTLGKDCSIRIWSLTATSVYHHNSYK